jgi:hypothetical protein
LPGILPGILPGSFAAGGRSSDHRAQLPGDLGRKLGSGRSAGRHWLGHVLVPELLQVSKELLELLV